MVAKAMVRAEQEEPPAPARRGPPDAVVRSIMTKFLDLRAQTLAAGRL